MGQKQHVDSWWKGKEMISDYCHNQKYFCPVCGYPGINESPYSLNEIPSYVICPCCWIEYGYDDGGRTGEPLQEVLSVLRNRWIEAGMRWTRGHPPAGWDPTAQLKNLEMDRGPEAGPDRYRYDP